MRHRNLDHAHGKGTVASEFVFAAANPGSYDEAGSSKGMPTCMGFANQVMRTAEVWPRVEDGAR